MIKIREARKEDRISIIPILMQSSKMHFKNRLDIFKDKTESETEEEVKEILENNDIKMLVAENESLEICGVLICQIKSIENHKNLKDAKRLWIDDIVVTEKQRNKGIGRILIEEAQKIAQKNNCQRIELNVWNFNTDAIKFYEKLGMNTQRRVMELKI